MRPEEKLGHCKHYYIEASRRQENLSKMFSQKVSLNCLRRKDFHIVKRTVLHDIILEYHTGTAKTVAVLTSSQHRCCRGCNSAHFKSEQASL